MKIPVDTAKTQKIAAWLSSPEGEAALEEAHETAEKVVSELIESRRIDPETYWRPYGPIDGSGEWPHQKQLHRL